MFHSARIKLTFWYLLIIMTISLAFSAIIYNFTLREVRRFSFEQRRRIQERLNNDVAPGSGPQIPQPFIIELEDAELMATVKKRTFVSLGLVNGVILLVSGGLGYVLAGKTLRPIQAMVDEQNRFISDASHELKTPLTSLKTSFEVFLRDRKSKPADAKNLIQDSIFEVNKLQHLSEALLSLAQFHRPSQQPAFEHIHLKKNIEETIKRVQSLAKDKQISISKNLADLTVKGDPYALSEVWTILLDNAIKYSPRKSEVSILAEKTGNCSIIKVRDQGTGISKGDIEHIFDRFYRSDKARTKKDSNGFGLGLSIAKNIVKVHKGSITVENNKQQGATFIVKLPLVKQ